MFPSTLWGEKSSSSSVQATQTEEKVRKLLTDEDIQVISSFELNQIATLTYHESSLSSGEDLCELVFEILQSVLSKPLQYTPLTMQKALVVTQHVLIFGADAVINESKILGRHVEALLEYNTVLLAQQQQSATSMFLRIKGGGVDKGGPVREKAQAVQLLLTDVNRLTFERNSRADPNSLVPVGSNKAAFVSDDVRLHALKKKMERQQMIEIRSNLAKADNGFGSGYNARDGKQFVGAAHGLDEMMKLAQAKERREKMKFSDDRTQQQQAHQEPFSSYVAPTMMMNNNDQHQQQAAAGTGDLLSMDDATNNLVQQQQQQQQQQQAPAAEADLLGFGGGNEPAPPSSSTYTNDLLMGGSATNNSLLQQATGGTTDLLGTGSTTSATTTSHTPAAAADVFSTGDLLGNMSININDTKSQQQQQNDNVLGASSQKSLATQSHGSENGQSDSPPNQPLTTDSSQQEKRPVMGGGSTMAAASTIKTSGGGSDDPFSAFDALSASTTSGGSGGGGAQIKSSLASTIGSVSSSAMAAQSRILGGFAGNNSSTTNTPGISVVSVNNNNYNDQGPKKDDSLNGLSPYSSVPLGQQGTAVVAAMPIMQQEQVPYHAPSTTSLNVSASQVPPSWGGNSADEDDDDGENGFIMGGTTGAGLEPVGPPPPTPPPPPPPTFY